MITCPVNLFLIIFSYFSIGNEGTNLKIPLMVLDDSGIGTSSSQLKEEAGLPIKSSYTTKGIKDKTQNFQNSRDNVNFQLREAGKTENASANSRQENASSNASETEHTYLKQSYPENIFDTPPNSLLCNTPVFVLETTTESVTSLPKLKQRDDATAVDLNNTNDLDDENVSDSTLVTSTSHSGSEPKEDVTMGENKNGSSQLTCDGGQPDRLGDKREGEIDDGRYNPPIPVQQWSPVKVPKKDENTGPSENAECYNERRGLPPDQWTSTKWHKREVIFFMNLLTTCFSLMGSNKKELF